MRLTPFRHRPTADEALAGLDLSGRSILVTGGDSGIGFETARALAAHGARVWLGCLRKETGDAAAARITNAHPGADVRTIAFDLGSLHQTAAAIQAFPLEPLHAVICNAGVYGGAYATTEDGFERTLGICYVGHVALVLGLMDRLVMGAPSRVVMVSSENHRWPANLDFDALPTPRERYSEMRSYGQAKLCCILFAMALDTRHSIHGVRGYALHPGNLVATGIDKDSSMLRLVLRLARPFSPTPSQAVATSVWVATAPELAHRGGRYFVDMRETQASGASLDRRTQDRLWEITSGWIANRHP